MSFSNGAPLLLRNPRAGFGDGPTSEKVEVTLVVQKVYGEEIDQVSLCFRPTGLLLDVAAGLLLQGAWISIDAAYWINFSSCWVPIS